LTDVLNPRRAARLPFRCPVEIRHRTLVWKADTEDLGPTGCQILTSRVIARGRQVKLTFRAEELGVSPVTVKGTVIWARPDSPSRIGVRFDPGTEAGWFERLLESDPAAAREAERIPERIPADQRIFLGLPPRRRVSFTADELAVLRAASGGATIEQLARATGDAFPRARNRLFSLIGRRMVVLDEAEEGSAERWHAILGDVVGARRYTPGGTPAAEAEMDELAVVNHLGPGGA
jgi:hypothetical protein